MDGVGAGVGPGGEGEEDGRGGRGGRGVGWPANRSTWLVLVWFEQCVRGLVCACFLN